MLTFAIMIFLSLGSVEGFSTKSQPCTYSKDKTCKPALANAIISTPILLAWHNYLCYFWFSWDENSNLYKCQDNFGSQERCWKGLHCCISLRCSHGIFTCCQWTSCALHCDQPIFKLYSGDDWEVLLEAITGYGLGGSSMALFGRVGGGVCTKAADVGG